MANYSPNKNKRSSKLESSESEVVEKIFVGLGHFLLWIWRLIFKKKGRTKISLLGLQSERQALAKQWDNVQQKRDEHNYVLAISEADKIMDASLKIYLRTKGESGGNTLADRLKSSEKYFPKDLYQRAWTAHKQRNTLLHELGATINEREATENLVSYQQVLQYLQIL
jgi:hypothetical protein